MIKFQKVFYFILKRFETQVKWVNQILQKKHLQLKDLAVFEVIAKYLFLTDLIYSDIFLCVL